MHEIIKKGTKPEIVLRQETRLMKNREHRMYIVEVKI